MALDSNKGNLYLPLIDRQANEIRELDSDHFIPQRIELNIPSTHYMQYL